VRRSVTRQSSGGRSWICSPPVGRKLKLRSHTTCRFVRSSATRGGRQQIDSGQILTDVRWRGIRHSGNRGRSPQARRCMNIRSACRASIQLTTRRAIDNRAPTRRYLQPGFGCPCHVCRTGWSARFRGLPFMKKRPARQKPMTRCPFLGTCISPIDKMLSMWVRWAWAPCRVQEVPGSGRRCLVRSDYRVPAPGAAASTNTASGSRRRPSQMPRPSWDQRARPADDVHRSG